MDTSRKRCRFRRFDQITYLHQADIFINTQPREFSDSGANAASDVQRNIRHVLWNLWLSMLWRWPGFHFNQPISLWVRADRDRMADGAAGIPSSQQAKPLALTWTCGDLAGSVFKHHPVQISIKFVSIAPPKQAITELTVLHKQGMDKFHNT